MVHFVEKGADFETLCRAVNRQNSRAAAGRWTCRGGCNNRPGAGR